MALPCGQSQRYILTPCVEDRDSELVFLQNKVLPAAAFLGIVVNYQMQRCLPCQGDKNWDGLPLEGVQAIGSSMV